MLLTIDAGNTRTKWALFDAVGEITWQGVCLNEAITSAEFLPENIKCDRTIIANVAGENHAKSIATQLEKYQIKNIIWAKPAAQACNVINGYTHIETLGIDRWAAMIAAWQLVQAPCVVVNAGTAATIDGLCPKNAHGKEYGEFKGGLILPGLYLMQQSLGLATTQLPMPDNSKSTVSNQSRQNIFAKTTADAIHEGALHAVSGAITLMSHTLNAIYRTWPTVVISGGDARVIKENLTADVTRQSIIVDNLVLHGLYLLANE